MTVGHLILLQNSFENKLITSDPEFSFFQNSINKISEFSMEDMTQYFVNDYGFGKRSSCFLHNNADLINNIYLVVKLPSLPFLKEYEDIGFRWKWVQSVGNAMIKSIDIEIGNTVVQSFTGTYLDIFHRLRYKPTKNIDKLIGNIDIITSYTKEKEPYKLYIPIPFWFTREYGNSLPISRMQVNKIRLNVEFEHFEDLVIYGPTHFIEIKEEAVLFREGDIMYQRGTGALGEFFKFDSYLKRIYYNPLVSTEFVVNTKTFLENMVSPETSLFICNENNTVMYSPSSRSFETNIEIKNKFNIISCYFLISYIFVDKKEQEMIKKKDKMEYLVQQTTQYVYNDIDSRKQSITINGRNPAYEIIWVCVSHEDKKFKRKFNYSQIITNNTLFLNNYDILTKRLSSYCSALQLFENYENNVDNTINCYSFSLYPQEYQPSGSLNIGKIEKIYLSLELDNRVNSSNKYDIYLFVNSYNILQIKLSAIKLLF